jgi:hypothetical protein
VGYEEASTELDQLSSQKQIDKPSPMLHWEKPLNMLFNLMISFDQKEPTSLVACGTL